jgi:hypothetical protein
MIFLSLFRLYASLGVGALVYFFIWRTLWFAIISAITFRAAWFLIERFIELMITNAHFQKYIYEFKQQLGPYGIRLANQAEKDRRTRKSLAEVFIADVDKLRTIIDRLKVLDTLYQAGMTPDQETRLLNDCKLKYATYRLEQTDKKAEN